MATGSRAGCAGRRSRCAARILCLAQTVEVFHAARGVDRGVPRGRASAAASGSTPTSSTRSSAFRADASFWESLAEPDLSARRAARPGADRRRGPARPDRRGFAAVIDAKSPWTHEHSRSGRPRSRPALPRCWALTKPALRDLRRAALLHDIGKLSISNRILDKPGAAHRRGVRTVARAPAADRADPRARPGLASSRRWRARITSASTEAATRAGSPRRAHDADADPGRRRRLRGAHLRSPVPAAYAPDAALELMRSDVPARLDADAFAALEAFVRNRPLAGPGQLTGMRPAVRRIK